MKIYRCTVLDSQYKKCVGMMEAEDELDVKQRIIAEGYSVLSVKEVSSEVKMTSQGFVPVDEVPVQGTTTVGIEPPEAHSEIAKKTFNKHHFIILFLLMVTLIGAYLYFILLPKLNVATPYEIVQSYFDYGYENQWNLQYQLVDQRHKSIFVSFEQYQQFMQEKWREYPQEYIPAEDESSKMILRNERYAIQPVSVGEITAEFKILLNYPKETKELFVFLNREKNVWEISFIRDLNKVENQIDRLAEGQREEVEEKIMLELSQLGGYTREEIEKLVRDAKIERLKKMRQDEIDRRERVKRLKMEKEKEKEQVQSVVSVEQEPEPLNQKPDLVQEKLEQAIKMIEEVGK